MIVYWWGKVFFTMFILVTFYAKQTSRNNILIMVHDIWKLVFRYSLGLSQLGQPVEHVSWWTKMYVYWPVVACFVVAWHSLRGRARPRMSECAPVSNVRIWACTSNTNLIDGWLIKKTWFACYFVMGIRPVSIKRLGEGPTNPSLFNAASIIF
jgi:hypothetical protein